MKKNTRKSTALVSLVLVPLNLMGLGFVGGCDGGDDSKSGSVSQSASSSSGGGSESADFDYRDPNDPFNLDPVTDPAGGAPATQPTTRPLASSGFAHAAPYHSGAYTHYRSGGAAFIPVPIPYRPGYRPPYRPMFRAPTYGSTGSSGSTGFRPGSSARSGSSWSSSASSSSSHTSRSSGVSRGGFGSSGHSASASS